MKRLLIFSLILVAAVVLAFSALPGQAQNKIHIKVGVSPVISSAGFYLAQLRGYYAEQGLDVELIPFAKSGPEIIPFVASDQFQVGGSSVAPGMFNAIAQGNRVKIVADKGVVDPQGSHGALLVRKDLIDSGRYKTGKDLKGMTIALASPGRTNVLAIGLDRFLIKHGLTLDNVNLEGIEFTAQLAALAGKKIDAAVAIEPFIAKAEQEGFAVRIPLLEETIPNFQVAVVYYSQQFSEKYPLEAKKFMIAYLKGNRDYINAMRYGVGFDSVAADLAKVLAVKDPALYKKMRITAFDPNGYVSKKSIGEAQDWFAAQGLVPKKVNLDQFVDNSFVEQALSELGKFQPPPK